MMQVQFGDTIYTGFTSVEATRDVESIASDFTIYATTLQGGVFPVQRAQKTIIFVDDTPILTGWVDKIKIDYSGGSTNLQHNITVTGRDKNQDLVDSMLDSKTQLSTPISLIAIIQNVLSYIGMTDTKIINNAGDIPSFTNSEIVTGYLAQNAYEFLDQYCIKRQVIMTSDGNGNIVLTNGQGTSSSAAAIMQLNGQNNNILEGNVEYDDTKRFNRYIVRSQANNAAPDPIASLDDDDPTSAPSTQNKAIVSVKGEATDDTVRKSRVLSINADVSSNVSDTVNRAQWEMQMRNARAINYQCTVQGHRQNGSTGDIWAPLQTIRVIDDFCGLDDNYLIRKVKYTWKLMSEGDGGAITTLDIVPLDTFTLMASQERRRMRKRKPKKGVKYFSDTELNKILYGTN